MPSKLVKLDDETMAAVNLLRQERRRSFQQLAEEAIKDLLAKYPRPVHVRDQLKESLREVAEQPSFPPAARAPRKKKS